MNIKIYKDIDGGWNLWATATDDPAAKPVYAAWGRTAEQLEALLRGILNEPTLDPAPEPTPAPVERDDTPSTNRKTGSHLALRLMLSALDGWVEGARSNHHAMEHRHENIGEECWRQIEPADVRGMVNDVAQECDVSPFPLPASPPEDAP